MGLKSERLKKLETELEDLERWLELGLVPKKDLEKHKNEILQILDKIKEEKEKLRFIKENGELEEFVAPKRSPQRQAYAEPQTLPDMNMGSDTDAGIDMESESYDLDTYDDETTFHGEDTTYVEEEEEDPFSDKNRWKRGILEDPDSDNW